MTISPLMTGSHGFTWEIGANTSFPSSTAWRWPTSQRQGYGGLSARSRAMLRSAIWRACCIGWRQFLPAQLRNF